MVEPYPGGLGAWGVVADPHDGQVVVHLMVAPEEHHFVVVPALDLQPQDIAVELL